MDRQTCLPRYTEEDHYFPHVMMALPFYLVAYSFLQGKRQSVYLYLQLREQVTQLYQYKEVVYMYL